MFTLQEISSALEAENVGDSQAAYILERLTKLQQSKAPKPMMDRAMDLCEVIQEYPKAVEIISQHSSRLNYRKTLLLNFFRMEGINCGFSNKELSDLAARSKEGKLFS